MDVLAKLEILADAAKYDASCASSGSAGRVAPPGKGIGSTEGMGICHSYAPDGRCISLLKILLTNFCTYECSYCINRNSSNVRRARFTVDEVVQLTLDFYRRNYIEGLFLSSGVIRSPDYTMGQLVEVARKLREDHDFRGYIHLKTIPDADGDLLAEAGRYADRLSINVELPTRQALADLAPEKDHRTIRLSMARIRDRLEESRQDQAKRAARIQNGPAGRATVPAFAPAGQSTQMIIGAEPSTDAQILSVSANLYASYRLKRVYYSAFSPIADPSARLPAVEPPLLREHRLYQSDWLMRFYGYRHDELTAGAQTPGETEVREGPEVQAAGVSNGAEGLTGDEGATEADGESRRAGRTVVEGGTGAGMLSLDIDPKLGWALRNRDYFPVDVNRADREQLLRAPGLGAKTVSKLLQMRRWRKVRLEDLAALKIDLKKAMPFIVCVNHRPIAAEVSSRRLLDRVAPHRQLSLELGP